MINDVHFDYLSLTLHPTYGFQLSYQEIAGWLSGKLGEDYVERVVGLRNYIHGVYWKITGAMVLYGGETQRGTIHVILPGVACRVLGLDNIRLFGDEFGRIAKVVVTRLDIALDKSGLKYLDDWQNIKLSLLSPYVKRYREVVERLALNDEIMSRTVYIGSRQSLRMLRIYGKLSDDGEPYTRVEIEVKGLPATALYNAFLEGKTIYDLAVSAFDKFFDVQRWLEVSISGACVPIEFSERRKMRRTIAWALTCCNAWEALWAYYGKENVDNMIREAASARKVAAKKVGKAKTPVGNTGVTNWSFDDYGILTADD